MSSSSHVNNNHNVNNNHDNNNMNNINIKVPSFTCVIYLLSIPPSHLSLSNGCEILTFNYFFFSNVFFLQFKQDQFHQPSQPLNQPMIHQISATI